MRYKFYEIGKKMKWINSEDNKPLTANQLQSLVGGYFDFFPLLDGTEVCCNDEGVIKRLPVNPVIQQKDTEVELSGGIRGNIIIGRLQDEEFVGVE